MRWGRFNTVIQAYCSKLRVTDHADVQGLEIEDWLLTIYGKRGEQLIFKALFFYS